MSDIDVTDEELSASLASQMDQGGDSPDQSSGMDDNQARQYITWWTERIQNAKNFHKKPFKRMQEDMAFVRGEQWPNQTENDDRYVVNVTQAEVASNVAVLYAKNPTFKARRKNKLDFELWDETQKSMQEAQVAVANSQAGAGPRAPDAEALLNDINEGKVRRQRADRIAQTAEIVLDQQLQQQVPSFKREMKQLVRRAETTGVGYLKLDFQRLEKMSPDDAAHYADLTSRLAHIEQLMAETEDESESGDLERKKEELRISLKTLQDQAHVITNEGLLVHFPASTAVIVDPACTQLEGFVGARWICEEYIMTADRIQQIYNKDVASKAKSFDRNKVDESGFMSMSEKTEDSSHDFDDMFRVWEVYHKDSGSVFTICEGFDEYLEEPTAPAILLEQFFPYYVLTFNTIEDDSSIYPPSTVRLIRHPQREVNRAKEALRQHRIASKPHYVTPEGALTDEDMKSMEAAPAHSVITVQGLQPGQNAAELLQQIQKHGIDPNVYETSSIFEDIRRITRRPAFGGGTSATADSLAAESQQVEERSKADDLDDFLNLFAKDAVTTLMFNMSKDTVIDIAGQGAAWPEVDPEDLLNDFIIEIIAGSSGRQNRALEVSTFQRLFPLLVQVPGIQPGWLARQAVQLADTNIDLSEAFIEGMPSIQALNAQAQEQAKAESGAGGTGEASGPGQPSTGNPETNPGSQGPEGSDTNERAPRPDNQMTVSQGQNQVPETATQNSILL